MIRGEIMEALGERLRVVDTGVGDEHAALAREVARGLTARHKRIDPRFLYDAEGSRLFERITTTPEYYVTRAETEILIAHAAELVAAAAPGSLLVELGSGSARKTRLLVDALLHRQARLVYAPIDVSREILVDGAVSLLAGRPGLRVAAIAAEYRAGLARLARTMGDTPRLITWLGSSVGNLTRGQAARFLAGVRATMTPRDRLLLGVDLRKDRRTLEAAYDDAAGITAAFSLNLLARVNRELGGTFALGDFAYRARWREAAGRIEMHLVARRAHRVTIAALGLTVPFGRGEGIFTERSVKYAPAEIDALARAAGFAVEQRRFDAARRFTLNLFAPAAG